MPDEGDRHWRRELTLSAHSILRPRAACSPIPRGLSGTQIERLPRCSGGDASEERNGMHSHRRERLPRQALRRENLMNRPWPQITRESTRFSDTDFFALDITTLVCCVAIPKVSAKATSMDIGSGIGRPFKEETCRQDCGCDMLDVLRGHTTGEETLSPSPDDGDDAVDLPTRLFRRQTEPPRLGRQVVDAGPTASGQGPWHLGPASRGL